MPVATTDRLSIELLTSQDGGFMLELLNDPAFIRNIADRGVRTLDQARDYLESGPLASYREHGFGMYALRLKDDGTTIGLCGLVKRPSLDHPDIGYALLPDWRQQGFALEASLAVRDLAVNKLGLDHLLAIVSPHNLASRALLEKLGLRENGSVRLTPEDEPVCLYEWQAGAA